MYETEVTLDKLAPSEMRRLSSLLAITHRTLSEMRDRLTDCLQSHADMRNAGVVFERDPRALAVWRDAQDVRTELEELTWRFIGHELPSAAASHHAMSLTSVLFGSERYFTELTNRRRQPRDFDHSWIKKLKELVDTALWNIPYLFAQACYVDKSGLLIAVANEDPAPDVDGPTIPCAKCPARRRHHPGSLECADSAGDSSSVSANRKAVQIDLRVSAVRPASAWSLGSKTRLLDLADRTDSAHYSETVILPSPASRSGRKSGQASSTNDARHSSDTTVRRRRKSFE